MVGELVPIDEREYEDEPLPEDPFEDDVNNPIFDLPQSQEEIAGV